MSEQRYIVSVGTATMIYKTKDLIKKNIPDCIKVDENKFEDFIESSKSLNHVESNGFVDMPPSIYEYRDYYYDEYNNLIAYKCRADYEKNWSYYINPELRDLGVKLQTQVKDEYGEEYEKRDEFKFYPSKALDLSE
jgi:hypothetical protein